MTEQEIVDYLKQNVEKGIPYAFMPEEVKKWAVDNNTVLIQYVNKKPNIGNFNYSTIIGLDDGFELTKKNDEWVEFEVDESGEFIVDVVGYHWSTWQKVLEDFYYNGSHLFPSLDYELTAFGGWQYESSTKWYLTPRIERRKYSVGFELADSYFEGDDTKILTPVRIRFWKEYKKR